MCAVLNGLIWRTYVGLRYKSVRLWTTAGKTPHRICYKKTTQHPIPLQSNLLHRGQYIIICRTI
jgi:hypothetical protein